MSEQQHDPFAAYIESDQFMVSLDPVPQEPPQIVRDAPPQRTIGELLGSWLLTLALDASFVFWQVVAVIVGSGARFLHWLLG